MSISPAPTAAGEVDPVTTIEAETRASSIARSAVASSARASSDGTDPTIPLPLLPQQETLFDCSQGRWDEIWYKFKRFETLSLLNLYHYQDELVEFEERLFESRNRANPGVPKGCFQTLEERARLRRLLREYHEALQLFRDISQMKRPPMKERRQAVKKLAEELHTTRYEDSIDAVGMVDLTPQALGVEPDSIRIFLSQTFMNDPNKSSRLRMADAESGPYQERTPGRKQANGRPSLMISGAIDRAARLLMATVSGLFLLVPMIVLSFIHEQGYRLVATCLFVFFFALSLSLTSKVSNHEIMTATATYAAVLVVFVGQTTPTDGTS